MQKIPELFGCMVFNDDAMRKYLPEDIFNSLDRTIQNGEPLDRSVANGVASGMKEWAI